MNVTTKTTDNTKAVKKRIEKGIAKSQAEATAYVWKVIKNSIKAGKATEKKRDTEYYDARGNLLFTGKPARKGLYGYLAKGKTKSHFQEKYLYYRHSTAGKPPRSWDNFSPIMNFYLKRRIQMSAGDGMIWVAPYKSDVGDRNIWRVHEFGGTVNATFYRPIVIIGRDRSMRRSNKKTRRTLHLPPRPFLRPGIEKSQKKITGFYANILE